MSSCEGCGKPAHREWIAQSMPNCGRKKCLVRMVVQRAGFPVGAFGATAVTSAGLNQLLKTGHLQASGWRRVIPAPGSGAIIQQLAAAVRRVEELEDAGVAVPVEEFTRRVQEIASQSHDPQK